MRRIIAAKFRMHLIIGSLVKLNQINEVLIHGRLFENFIKSWIISLVTYKNMQKDEAAPTSVVYYQLPLTCVQLIV